MSVLPSVCCSHDIFNNNEARTLKCCLNISYGCSPYGIAESHNLNYLPTHKPRKKTQSDKRTYLYFPLFLRVYAKFSGLFISNISRGDSYDNVPWTSSSKGSKGPMRSQRHRSLPGIKSDPSGNIINPI